MLLDGGSYDGDMVVLPRRRSGIHEFVCDGETVLFDVTTWCTCVLNATAYDVWQRCDGHTTMRQLARSNVENYEVDFETALDHVEQVAALFASLNFLDVEAPDATAAC